MQIAVVSARPHVALARLTIGHAAALPGTTVHVLDADGSYRPVGDERVLTPAAAGIPTAELHRRAVVLDHADFVRSLAPALLRAVRPEPGQVTVLLDPGVLLLREPGALVGALDGQMVLVSLSAGPLPDDGRHPDVADMARSGAYAGMLALRNPPPGLLDLWERATSDPAGPGERWLDLAAATFPHTTVRDAAFLVSAGSLRREHQFDGDATEASALRLDGRPVTGLDLTAFDPELPWLLDSAAAGDPRGRLSDHPALVGIVERLARTLRADTVDGQAPVAALTTTSLGFPVDGTIRSLFRAVPAGMPGVPDPLDPAASAALLDFLAAPSLSGGPGRYLRTLHANRPDLQAAYPLVPGEDEGAFLTWVRTHAVAEGCPSQVVDEALRRTPDAPRVVRRAAPGVNVVGFLRGELGIGESARLLVGALEAAHVPHRSVSVEQHLASRQRAVPVAGGEVPTEVYDTSIMCVNADLTPTIARSVPRLMDRSYRIGMWYWEVEEFPASQHPGFSHVDEVWVATEFVRRAVEPHSPVPVRVVTPPLPQRGPDPTLTRADLGLPDSPLFLFSFDYLSTAERKNPLGLIEAFRSAFRPGEGPILVLKSINAEQRPSAAEQLRLRAATMPDVMLLEEYLDAEARDALVALCDCYVSLHRAEGLGLTIAEAMSWGKPVIATAYSGNLQFMTAENSFLVPWSPTAIPEGAEPYPPGGVWANPDLEAAAALMRLVLEAPDVAAARGAQAAADIAVLHSAEVAGARIASRLAETAARRRARSRSTLATRLHRAAVQGRRPFS